MPIALHSSGLTLPVSCIFYAVGSRYHVSPYTTEWSAETFQYLCPQSVGRYGCTFPVASISSGRKSPFLLSRNSASAGWYVRSAHGCYVWDCSFGLTRFPHDSHCQSLFQWNTAVWKRRCQPCQYRKRRQEPLSSALLLVAGRKLILFPLAEDTPEIPFLLRIGGHGNHFLLLTFCDTAAAWWMISSVSGVSATSCSRAIICISFSVSRLHIESMHARWMLSFCLVFSFSSSVTVSVRFFGRRHDPSLFI